MKILVLVLVFIQAVIGSTIESSSNTTDAHSVCSPGFFRCGGFGLQGVCCSDSDICCPGSVFASCCALDQQCMGFGTSKQMCCLKGSRLCGDTCCLDDQFCDLGSNMCVDHSPVLTLNKELAHAFVVYSFISYCLPSSNISAWDCYWCKKVPKVDIMAEGLNADSDSYAYVGLSLAEKLIVVAFRGTCDYDNIMTDTNFVKTKPYADWPSIEVHRGFYNAYSSIADSITSGVIKSLAKCPTCRVVVTGHSLGGALATLAAFDLRAFVSPARLFVFTYGSPRVGNQYFAQIYGKHLRTTWRFVHAADPIPHLPGTDVSFWHVSTEMWIVNGTYIEQCESVGEDPKCSDSLYIWDYDFGLSDHKHYLGEFTEAACSC